MPKGKLMSVWNREILFKVLGFFFLSLLSVLWFCKQKLHLFFSKLMINRNTNYHHVLKIISVGNQDDKICLDQVLATYLAHLYWYIFHRCLELEQKKKRDLYFFFPDKKTGKVATFLQKMF